MLARLCQLKSLWILTLVITSACSFNRPDYKKDLSHEILSQIKPKWFGKNPQHALYNQEGKPQPHLFFDISPDMSRETSKINAVILTPENSSQGYELDIASGQRFYSHSYCGQSDIWHRYSGSIKKPIYAIGVIPRLLDQTGEPQKVIIFGEDKRYSNVTEYDEHRVRLLGAYIEQRCLEGNCLGKNNWVSRMVFMAVDPLDEKFRDVKTIEDLQHKVEWAEVEATVGNLDGRNAGGKVNYPSVRMGAIIQLSDVVDYYKKRSVSLNEDESQKIRSSCHALYEKLWNDVGLDKPKEKQPPFHTRFKTYMKRYYTEHATCQKFVYAGNVNENPEKFWFLSYVGLYVRLNKDGYYFDCKNHSWSRNTLNSSGNPTFDMKKNVDQCDARDVDMAMEYMPNFLTGLKNSASVFYKFVDYDTHSFGTHQKLYSWVKVESKKFDCYSDPNLKIKEVLKVFPEGISWKAREIKVREEQLKVFH